MPLHIDGSETGLIVGAQAFFGGLIASIIAAMFALIALSKSRLGNRPSFLVAWCSVLLLGFAIILYA
jgi:hypothetical protein